MTKWVSAALGFVLATVSLSTFAQFRPDVRLKLGGAAGIDKVEFTNILTGDATREPGGNFQVEMVWTQNRESPVSFVASVGPFSRLHNGKVNDPVLPTDIEYQAIGIGGSVGASFRATQGLHFEGRFELGIGAGEPELRTPGFIWNDVRAGGYSSASLIFGGYYTFSRPGVQLGLELAAQSFVGDFQIWNNAGFWNDAKVEGGGLVGNFIVGYRF